MMESLKNVLNVISVFTKNTYKDTLIQFMRGKSHTNVTFAIPTLKQRMNWKNIKQKFMKERNSFSAVFVALVLRQKTF